MWTSVCLPVFYDCTDLSAETLSSTNTWVTIQSESTSESNTQDLKAHSKIRKYQLLVVEYLRRGCRNLLYRQQEGKTQQLMRMMINVKAKKTNTTAMAAGKVSV